VVTEKLNVSVRYYIIEDFDIKGAGEAIRNAMGDADPEKQQELQAALAALGRADR